MICILLLTRLTLGVLHAFVRECLASSHLRESMLTSTGRREGGGGRCACVRACVRARARVRCVCVVYGV